ncbi:hypothetical protein [Tenacibaculum maritimum]|uniref:hypothetical protein n=1 Tax=Tenacibaculum maritimum TaxID=107401 RepID=UPI0012E5E061|nr:hypothetical protein [Tenacibaculum maritimum]MCD9620378.1 hypothetical protein [Tenacibaculum maritimum]MCD9626699.1 hypothetical protein [Tenacibaculum maritimum]MCD9629096.1 hypothetical protein [Tenacibaculum maritimum]MCD9632509.1 hypothetical protein [Tenacibaculum maritimum]CAA0147689.1 conserved hypothetical protein [Tenacibaculum maritimum]
METRAIKSELTKFVKATMGSKNPRFNGWYAGITNNEKRRKGEHSVRNGKILHWKCINADTMAKANEVEAFFSAKGTQNMPQPQGANIASKWVYIFKLAKKPQGMNGLAGPLDRKTVYEYVFNE